MWGESAIWPTLGCSALLLEELQSQRGTVATQLSPMTFLVWGTRTWERGPDQISVQNWASELAPARMCLSLCSRVSRSTAYQGAGAPSPWCTGDPPHPQSPLLSDRPTWSLMSSPQSPPSGLLARCSQVPSPQSSRRVRIWPWQTFLDSPSQGPTLVILHGFQLHQAPPYLLFACWDPA